MAAPRNFGKLSTKNEFITSQTLTDLKTNGWCIVRSILSENDCTEAKDLLYDWLEGLGTGLDRKNLGAATSEQLPQHLHGIVTYPNACHTPVATYVRFHPKVAKLFSELWGTTQCVTSFDRINYMKPQDGKAKNSISLSDNNWAHVDQGHALGSSLQCIQASITLEDVTPQDGCLVVLQGSHLHHAELLKRMKNSDVKNNKKTPTSDNFLKLSKDDFEWMNSTKNCEITKVVNLRKGDAVLWDSRTVHWNCKTQGNERLVVYVCRVPASWAENAPRKQMERKREAFMNCRGTNHWPHMLRLFSVKPRTYGAELPAYSAEWTEDSQVIPKHLNYFEQICQKRGNFPEAVRAAGFKDEKQYEQLKRVAIGTSSKKRKRSEEQETTEKDTKKAKTTNKPQE